VSNNNANQQAANSQSEGVLNISSNELEKQEVAALARNLENDVSQQPPAIQANDSGLASSNEPRSKTNF
jgi:hypothetical protein